MDDRANGEEGGGWRWCRAVSIYLAFCRVPEYVLYLQATRVFQDAASSADEKRVYYAIRLEVTRSEGGSPLSMNPMRGGGPAAVCAREHKADFQ